MGAGAIFLLLLVIIAAVVIAVVFYGVGGGIWKKRTEPAKGGPDGEGEAHPVHTAPEDEADQRFVGTRDTEDR